jgi:hypothetical protein
MFGEIPKNDRKFVSQIFDKKAVRIFFDKTFIVQANGRSLMDTALISELKVHGSNLPQQCNSIIL